MCIKYSINDWMTYLFRRTAHFNVVLKVFWTMMVGIISVGEGHSQDPLFSQYYAMPMQINPGFSGINYAPRMELIYRNQWPVLDPSAPAYVTYAVAYDQFFKSLNSGIGFQLLADDAGGGLIKTIKGAFTYGYQAQIKRDHFLRGGIELGFVQTRYGWDKFVFGDQLHPEFGFLSPGGTPIASQEIRPDKVQTSYLDIGTGLLYISPTFNIGISAKHINSPSNDILKINASAYNGIPIRWVIHGSGRWPVDRSRKVILNPSVLLARQSSFFQANLGGQLEFSNFFGGLWYRIAKDQSDALITVLGFRKQAWKFSYSFDYTTSALGIGSGGSHELSIGIFLERIRKQKVDISDCFEAFR